MPYDPIIVKVKSDKTTAIVSPSGGASFGVVNVTGQNNVVATKTTDILKVRQGTGIAITTDSTNGSLTITAQFNIWSQHGRIMGISKRM